MAAFYSRLHYHVHNVILLYAFDCVLNVCPTNDIYTTHNLSVMLESLYSASRLELFRGASNLFTCTVKPYTLADTYSMVSLGEFILVKSGELWLCKDNACGTLWYGYVKITYVVAYGKVR